MKDQQFENDCLKESCVGDERVAGDAIAALDKVIKALRREKEELALHLRGQTTVCHELKSLLDAGAHEQCRTPNKGSFLTPGQNVSSKNSMAGTPAAFLDALGDPSREELLELVAQQQQEIMQLRQSGLATPTRNRSAYKKCGIDATLRELFKKTFVGGGR